MELPACGEFEIGVIWWLNYGSKKTSKRADTWGQAMGYSRTTQRQGISNFLQRHCIRFTISKIYLKQIRRKTSRDWTRDKRFNWKRTQLSSKSKRPIHCKRCLLPTRRRQLEWSYKDGIKWEKLGNQNWWDDSRNWKWQSRFRKCVAKSFCRFWHSKWQFTAANWNLWHHTNWWSFHWSLWTNLWILFEKLSQKDWSKGRGVFHTRINCTITSWNYRAIRGNHLRPNLWFRWNVCPKQKVPRCTQRQKQKRHINLRSRLSTRHLENCKDEPYNERYWG